MTAAPLARTPQPPSVDQGVGKATPAVSVIIATYNSGSLLTCALDALEAQTLPGHLIEVLVVDDGSTDDTWRLLMELEGRRSNIKIFRQSHTGGPSAGRNRALAEATGEFVFFHDADDYLGADALRRFVGVAQQHASDVVAGRVSWIGRPEGEPGPTKTVFDADLLDDGVWRSLTPHKLIRRSLIEDHRLRFCDDMVQGEDQSIHGKLPLRRTQDQHPERHGSLPPADAHRRQQPVAATSNPRQQTPDDVPDGRSRRSEHHAGRAPGSPAAAGLRTHPPTSFESPVHGGQTGRAKGVPRGDASRGLPLFAVFGAGRARAINNG